ncbi:MAG: hypothetical protein AABY15_01320, partial [Nanoarchaeota archaeon]
EGCSRDAPQRSKDVTTYTFIPYVGSIPMWDQNGDGNVDLIKNQNMTYAVDTSVNKNYETTNKPAIMDSSMIALATQVAKLQMELGFRIDSARYYGGKEVR